MKGTEIPVEIMEFIQKYDISTYEVLQINERKGRFCLKCLTKSKDIFLKWNSKENRHHFDLIEKERQIYMALRQWQLTPQLLEEYEPYFATTYIKFQKTLRSVLYNLDSNEVQVLEFLEGTLEKWKKLVVVLDNDDSILNMEELGTSTQIRSYFESLMCSGPLKTKASHWVYKFNLLIYRLFWRLYRYKIIEMVDLSANRHYIHGDLHLNNIMINETGSIIFIDFENVVLAQPEVELAYVYVQIWALLYNNVELLTKVEQFIKEKIIRGFLDQNLYDKIVSLYKAGICNNRRFYKEDIHTSFFQKVKVWKNAICELHKI